MTHRKLRATRFRHFSVASLGTTQTGLSAKTAWSSRMACVTCWFSLPVNWLLVQVMEVLKLLKNVIASSRTTYHRRGQTSKFYAARKSAELFHPSNYLEMTCCLSELRTARSTRSRSKLSIRVKWNCWKLAIRAQSTTSRSRTTSLRFLRLRVMNQFASGRAPRNWNYWGSSCLTSNRNLWHSHVMANRLSQDGTTASSELSLP